MFEIDFNVYNINFNVLVWGEFENLFEIDDNGGILYNMCWWIVEIIMEFVFFSDVEFYYLVLDDLILKFFYGVYFFYGLMFYFIEMIWVMYIDFWGELGWYLLGLLIKDWVWEVLESYGLFLFINEVLGLYVL